MEATTVIYWYDLSLDGVFFVDAPLYGGQLCIPLSVHHMVCAEWHWDYAQTYPYTTPTLP